MEYNFKNLNMICADVYDRFFKDFEELTSNMQQEDKDSFVESLKHYKSSNTEALEEAKTLVSQMCSRDDSGRKYIGERYSIDEVVNIKEKYKLNNECVTIYIAINHYFHVYHCLYKLWFGNNIEDKIIEGAIHHWFKEVDTSLYHSKIIDYIYK